MSWSAFLSDFNVRSTDSFADLAAEIGAGTVDCVLIAGELPGLCPVEIVELAQGADPDLPVVIWDSEMRASDAVRLVRAGAYHCVGHRDSMDSVRDDLLSAVEERRCRKKAMEACSDPAEPWRAFLVGQSPAMARVTETIRLIGPRRCTVLIGGETGTGKEMAARALHMASPRANYPMVAVNCSALPDNLLETELFGHVKGAFTGAVNARVGRFEQANRGTIFLDEIGDMPLDLQAKLLRVLQDREIQRLGSSETIKVDVRVIAATNVNLVERIRQGKFREDLYYRLNVVPLQMPALRERTGDIPLLIDHFLQKVCKAEGLSLKKVMPETLKRLSECDWPGNVRQLENAVEMAVAMSGSRESLHPADFGQRKALPANVVPFDSGSAGELPESMDFNSMVTRFELSMLQRALARTGGNKTAAAELLGMKRTTLIMKLRNIEPSAQPIAS